MSDQTPSQAEGDRGDDAETREEVEAMKIGDEVHVGAPRITPSQAEGERMEDDQL